MHAFITVLENPFYTATNKDGSFTLPDVPSGTYQVRAWVDPTTTESKSVTVSEKGNITLNFTLPPKTGLE
jgi:hypothetical protein